MGLLSGFGGYFDDRPSEIHAQINSNNAAPYWRPFRLCFYPSPYIHFPCLRVFGVSSPPCKAFLTRTRAYNANRISIHTVQQCYATPFHELSTAPIFRSVLSQVLHGQSADIAVISAVGVLKCTVRTHTSTGSPPAVASSTRGCGNLVE